MIQKHRGDNCVQWYSHKVRELPRAIDKDVNVFSQNVNQLCLSRLRDLVLLQPASHLEK